MGFVKNGMSAIGKLLIVTALAGTFLVGMLSVFYLSLIGEEVEIPKIVGKNVNAGENELENLGLRLQKVAYRYSTEPPNTILEQRPKAGEAGKTGLMVSVILSKADPDGNEAPISVEDKEKEAKEKEEDIKDLPELETEKSKAKEKKTDKKTAPKTRDIIKKDKDKKDEDKSKNKDSKEENKSDAENKPADEKKETKSETDKPVTPPTPKNTAKPATEKPPKPAEKPKTSGDTRSRRVPPSN